eukprot:g2639.t1
MAEPSSWVLRVRRAKNLKPPAFWLGSDANDGPLLIARAENGTELGRTSPAERGGAGGPSAFFFDTDSHRLELSAAAGDTVIFELRSGGRVLGCGQLRLPSTCGDVDANAAKPPAGEALDANCWRWWSHTTLGGHGWAGWSAWWPVKPSGEALFELSQKLVEPCAGIGQPEPEPQHSSQPRVHASVPSVAMWLRLRVRAAHGLRNTQLWGEQQPVVKATLRAGAHCSSCHSNNSASGGASSAASASGSNESNSPPSELASDVADVSVASSACTSGDGTNPVWDVLDAGATLRLPLGRAREFVGAGRRARLVIEVWNANWLLDDLIGSTELDVQLEQGDAPWPCVWASDVCAPARSVGDELGELGAAGDAICETAAVTDAAPRAPKLLCLPLHTGGYLMVELGFEHGAPGLAHAMPSAVPVPTPHAPAGYAPASDALLLLSLHGARRIPSARAAQMSADSLAWWWQLFRGGSNSTTSAAMGPDPASVLTSGEDASSSTSSSSNAVAHGGAVSRRGVIAFVSLLSSRGDAARTVQWRRVGGTLFAERYRADDGEDADADGHGGGDVWDALWTTTGATTDAGKASSGAATQSDLSKCIVLRPRSDDSAVLIEICEAKHKGGADVGSRAADGGQACSVDIVGSIGTLLLPLIPSSTIDVDSSKGAALPWFEEAQLPLMC